MGIYDDVSTSNGSRFIILTDTKQDVPTGRLYVMREEMRKTYAGKEYPVLTVEDEDGNAYDVAAWPRDVKRVLIQYGNSTQGWNDQGGIRLQKNSNGSRWEFVPCELQVTEERV